MAYETIDKHVDEGYGDKIALHYKLDDQIQSFTLKEMKEQSNKGQRFKRGVQGDRVFVWHVA